MEEEEEQAEEEEEEDGNDQSFISSSKMSRIHDYARVISPCGSHTLVWLWLDFGFAPPEQEEPKDAKSGVQGSALLSFLCFLTS